MATLIVIKARDVSMCPYTTVVKLKGIKIGLQIISGLTSYCEASFYFRQYAHMAFIFGAL